MIGVLSTYCLFVLLVIATDKIGIATSIKYDESITITNRYYDREINESDTSLGSLIIAISIAFGARSGMAFYKKSWNGGVSKKGNLQIFIIFGCLAIYTTINMLMWEIEIFEKLIFIANLFDFGLAIGIGILGFKFYRKKCNDWNITQKS